MLGTSLKRCLWSCWIHWCLWSSCLVKRICMWSIAPFIENLVRGSSLFKWCSSRLSTSCLVCKARLVLAPCLMYLGKSIHVCGCLLFRILRILVAFIRMIWKLLCPTRINVGSPSRICCLLLVCWVALHMWIYGHAWLRRWLCGYLWLTLWCSCHT